MIPQGLESFSEVESVMFYNVENLFVADVKPVSRHIPSASGLKNWNSWRYENKIHKLASVFKLVKEENGSLPMLIGLSEIQGRSPLEALVKLEPFNENYGIVHYESMDERGVDVAMLYDKSKLELLASEPIGFVFEIDDENPENYDTTRDVLFCKLRYKDAIINYFVLHLPSKRDKDINRPKRDYIIREIRERILDLIKNHNEGVVLCGDFNENPDDENLQKLVLDEEGNKILENPFFNLYKENKFSTFHYKDGLLFDQILFSEHFLGGLFPLGYKESQIFSPKQISNWDKKFEGRPFRTYAGTRYLGGYSDHFPVITKFKKK